MEFLKRWLCQGCKDDLTTAEKKLKLVREELVRLGQDRSELAREVDELHVRLNAILKLARPDLPLITWTEGDVTHMEVGLEEPRDPEELGDLVLDDRGRPFSS